MEEVIVSVCCTAYNHEKYIRKCLDGFVMQKTDFKYEVIINDDASTDCTADIIREYEEKYPDIIKPIYQTENQYSIDRNITSNILFPNCKGKYIALCEGDDYWIDPLKLQKEVDALEANPECTMCVGRVERISEDESIVYGLYPQKDYEGGKLNSRRFLEIVLTEDVFHTSTYFFRSDCMKTYMNPIPKFRKICPVGDKPYQLFFGQLGPVYYIPEIVSRYRQGSIGSWSQSVAVFRDRHTEHLRKMIETYREFDTYTDWEYHDLCARRVFYELYRIAENQRDYKELLNAECFDRQTVKIKIKIYLGAYVPSALKLYYRIIG